MTDDSAHGVSRRDLIKSVAAAGAGFGLSQLGFPSDAHAELSRAGHDAPPLLPSMMDVKFDSHAVPRIAIVGTASADGARSGSCLA